MDERRDVKKTHCTLKKLIHSVHYERVEMVDDIVLRLKTGLALPTRTRTRGRGKRKEFVCDREHACRALVELLRKVWVYRAVEGYVGGQTEGSAGRFERAALELGIVVVERRGGDAGGSRHRSRVRRGRRGRRGRGREGGEEERGAPEFSKVAAHVLAPQTRSPPPAPPSLALSPPHARQHVRQSSGRKRQGAHAQLYRRVSRTELLWIGKRGLQGGRLPEGDRALHRGIHCGPLQRYISTQSCCRVPETRQVSACRPWFSCLRAPLTSDLQERGR